MTQPGNYEKNRAAIETHRPRMGPWLDHCRFDASRYQLLKTQTQFPTLRINPPGGQSYLCYNPQNPIQDVERQIAAIDRKSPYAPYLFGMGAGYTLRMMYDRHKHEFFDMVVVEQDPVFLRIAFELMDFTDVIADTRCFFFIGTEMEHWETLLTNQLHTITTSRLEILPQCPAVEQMPFYQLARHKLIKRNDTAAAEIKLMINHGEILQENIIRNLPVIAQSAPLKPLENAWKGKPAFVVAAGPSLDKNVEQLAAVQDRYPIIAVDTALRTLLKHGITPHFLCSTDPTELNRKHFEDLTLPDETTLVLDMEVYWEIPELWQGPCMNIEINKSVVGRWVEESLGPHGFIRKGLSIGNSAFMLAQYLGAAPIVLVGLDLAFDVEGGRTHTAGAALYREYGSFKQNTREHQLSERLDGDKAAKEHIEWVPGTHHERVPTSPVMALYIHQLEGDIADSTVIDATEGGARFEGTTVQSLQETIAGLPDVDGSPQSLLPEVVEREVPQKFVDDLIAVRETVAQLSSVAEEGIALVEKLQSQLHLAEALRQTPEWKAMEKCFTTLHGDDKVKTVMEQILFDAFFTFVKKEWPYQVHVRASKYKQYFEAFLKHQPSVLAWVDEVIEQFKQQKSQSHS